MWNSCITFSEILPLVSYDSEHFVVCEITWKIDINILSCLILFIWLKQELVGHLFMFNNGVHVQRRFVFGIVQSRFQGEAVITTEESETVGSNKPVFWIRTMNLLQSSPKAEREKETTGRNTVLCSKVLWSYSSYVSSRYGDGKWFARSSVDVVLEHCFPVRWAEQNHLHGAG